MTKKSILAIVVLVVAFLFWFFVDPWVQNPVGFSDWSVWLAPLVLLVLLNCLVTVAFALLKGVWRRLIISLFVAVPFIVIFGFNRYTVLALLLMFLLQLYAARSVVGESQNKIKVSFSSVIQHGSPRIITSLLILISFAYFLTPGIRQANNPESLSSAVETAVTKIANSFIGKELNNLSPQERKQAENKVIDQTVSQFIEIIRPFAKFFPPLIAFGMFLILQGLSFVFVWFSVLAGLPLFWIMKKSGFVRIEKVQREAEELVM